MKWPGLVVILLVTAAIPSSANDEVIKCRSKTGQVIYSNVPCDKQNASPQGSVEIQPRQPGSVGRPQESVQDATRLEVPTDGMLEPDQVPYVNGFIGRNPVRFMVDAGASEISIPHKRAIALGIPVFAGRRAESTTASGTVGIYKIRLESVTVGNVTVRDVAAHVSLNDAGSQVVLLGMCFLRYVNLNLRNGIVRISP